MGVQQSAQLASQSHQPQKRPRWLSIIIIVACILALLSFIGATIFWIGLVHDKLPDTLGAIFTALGTIFGFIALVLAIPPFIQYLRERRSVSSPISAMANTNNKNVESQLLTQQPTLNSRSIDSLKAQSYSTSVVGASQNSQQPSPPNQPSQLMNRTTLNTPTRLRALSPREKEQLVDKLLACRTMRDRNSRNQVVQELSFADSIDRDSNTTNKDDVMNIVNRCLDFSDGLLQLIERIEYREENSQPMQHLRKFLQILFSSPQPIMINVDLLAKLYKLTNNVRVAKEELHKLYRQTGVDDGRLPRRYQNIDEGETLRLMIQELAQVGLQSTPTQNRLTHPLLTFVRLLLHRVPDAVKDSLLHWLVETAKKEHIALAEECSSYISNEQPTHDSHYLLVEFKPGNEKKTEFEIHAWLIREQTDKTVPIYGDVKEEATLEEIPSVMEELISHCAEYADAFTIELFLPFRLLNCDTSETDMHTWKLDAAFGNTIAVSHKNPLVLRSYDRIYEINKLKPGVRRRLRQAWESNWAICENCGVVMLRWPLKEKDSCKEHLVVWLQEAACLTMLFVPPAFDEIQPHIFKKLLSAGTSVALWPRLYCKHLDEEVIEQGYRSLLEGHHFSTLPKMIWERRKEAAIDETLLANHLTLLWDDPYRLPPDAPDAPAQDKYPLAFPRERK